MRGRSIVPLVAAVALGCGTPHGDVAERRVDAGGFFLFFDAGGFVCPDASTVESPDAAGCTPSRTVTYESDVLPIFANHCNGETCHNATWGSGAAYDDLVGKPSHECCERRLLVRPGDPEGSYVIDKLRGENLCGGRSMPLGRTIDPSDILTIADWICEGAPR
jgi:hypothetical protein